MPEKKNGLLSSWKEIAAYLDCDVRTAHRWEKEYGLPVYRLGKGSRARVFAYEHELAAWLRSRTESAAGRGKRGLRWVVLLVTAVLVLTGGAGYFVYRHLAFDREPYGFDIDQSELIILNRDGMELWRHDFNLPTPLDEEYYRQAFRTADLDGDGFLEVILFSNQYMEFPTQMLRLDHEGDILGEYWNSGRFNDIFFYDVQGNGRKDIIVAGKNNEFKAPIIVVFDGEDISGSSPNSGEYASPSLAPGSEKYYIRLPVSEPARALNPHEGTGYIVRRADGSWAFFIYPSGLEYRFDENFRIQEVRTSDTYERLFREAKRAGYITGSPDEAHMEKLKQGVRYYGGEKWTAEPAMRNEW
ncbi:MAG: helix-turn-helix domain-containing protein [Candidatus Aminicenantes bacterium]